uniref:Uncharacterized protein n=1 Tax=Arundo donax TaxID=35708 RepID=A0A0A9D877_ARUDO
MRCTACAHLAEPTGVSIYVMGWRIRVSRGHPTDDRNWTVSSVHICLICRDDSKIYLNQFNLDGSATDTKL